MRYSSIILISGSFAQAPKILFGESPLPKSVYCLTSSGL